MNKNAAYEIRRIINAAYEISRIINAAYEIRRKKKQRHMITGG